MDTQSSSSNLLSFENWCCKWNSSRYCQANAYISVSISSGIEDITCILWKFGSLHWFTLPNSNHNAMYLKHIASEVHTFEVIVLINKQNNDLRIIFISWLKNYSSTIILFTWIQPFRERRQLSHLSSKKKCYKFLTSLNYRNTRIWCNFQIFYDIIEIQFMPLILMFIL